MMESKHFIKHNIKQVCEIESQIKSLNKQHAKEIEIIQKKASKTPKGELPKYLQQRKKQEALERQQT